MDSCSIKAVVNIYIGRTGTIKGILIKTDLQIVIDHKAVYPVCVTLNRPFFNRRYRDLLFALRVRYNIQIICPFTVNSNAPLLFKGLDLKKPNSGIAHSTVFCDQLNLHKRCLAQVIKYVIRQIKHRNSQLITVGDH